MSKKIVRSLVCDNCTHYVANYSVKTHLGRCDMNDLLTHVMSPFCPHFSPTWVLTVVTDLSYAIQYENADTTDFML